MKKTCIVTAVLLAIIASFFFLPQEAHAVTKTWTGGEGGWADPANWSPEGVPASTDIIIIDGDDETESVVTLDIDFNLEGSIVIEEGDSLVIDLGYMLFISGSIVNYGNIKNHGTISNGGTIENDEYIYNFGTISNGGTINNNYSIINGGTIHNNIVGIIENQETGTINNQNGGIIKSSDTSTIYNYGIIENWSYIKIHHISEIYNYGTIDNNFGNIHNFGGTIDNYGTIDNRNIGTIKNDTTIYNNCGAIIMGNAVTGMPVIDTCNEPPVANDDFYSTLPGVTLNVNAPGVLENDTDPDDDGLFVEDYPQPDNGSVAVNIDGSFTYIPDIGFTGEDSFTYTVSDGSDTDTATVNITVNPGAPAETVKKIDLQFALQLPFPRYTIYHLGTTMDGLPVVAELESAQAMKFVEEQGLVYEDIGSDVTPYSAGPGHLRLIVNREDASDYMMFQFVVRYNDGGVWRYGTTLVMNGNVSFGQNELTD